MPDKMSKETAYGLLPGLAEAIKIVGKLTTGEPDYDTGVHTCREHLESERQTLLGIVGGYQPVPKRPALAPAVKEGQNG